MVNLLLNSGGALLNGKPIIYLTQWKIVGNSEVHDNEIWSCGEPRPYSITLYDSTKELSDGFLPQSGSYPTTNSSYPNAKYYVFDVKAGYIVRTRGYTNGQIRLRLIDNNVVINDINTNSTTYYTSSWDTFGSKNGDINIQKDCQIGILILDSDVSYEGGSVVALSTQYHILVQPQGGSIADIALTEPLRKVNDVADTIEFPSETEGKALVTRKLVSVDKGTLNYSPNSGIKIGTFTASLNNCKYTYGLTADGEQETTIIRGWEARNLQDKGWCFLIRTSDSTYLFITYYAEYAEYNASEFAKAMSGKEFIYELATPTTELVDAPQIQEAESYSMVISQGGKAVSWSSFEIN